MGFFKVLLLSFFAILFLLTNSLFAQTDPGAPDTVKFGEWKACVPCPPCSGRAAVPVEFFNDEGIFSFFIALKESKNINTDTALFVPEWEQIISVWKLYIGDSIQSPPLYQDKILVGAVSYTDSIPPTAESKTIYYLNFIVKDTGLVSLDSITWCTPTFCYTVDFWLPTGQEFYPQFLKTEFLITPTQQGDANLDGEVNLGDVIYLARYIFGKEPIVFDKCTPCEDINGDGKLDLSDVIELAKFILGG